MNEIKVEIKKLVNGGQGLGFYDGKPVFAWNVLPGETATVKLIKKKKDYLEGIAVQITDCSPERVDPEENHFMSCSPWQIMSYTYENFWKKEIAKETFKNIGGVELLDLEIVYDQNLFGYRNKVEYGFCANEDDGKISFAFHKRGSNEKLPIGKCLLASENINKAAIEILDVLNSKNINVSELKSLILRDNNKNEVVASLFVTNDYFKALKDIFKNFQIYFFNPKNHTAKLLHSFGIKFIVEEIAGKIFKCSPLSFFQVNKDVFEKTLSRIGMFIAEGEEIVDFYSGVGSIAVALGDKVKSAILVESDNEASALASENILINGLDNFISHTGSSENRLDEIVKDKTIIFDPPRAGLHPKVLSKLLDVLPDKIIYLSCNIATQARDLKRLSEKYKVKFCELYNYFPRTPHTESLIILERRGSKSMRKTKQITT